MKFKVIFNLTAGGGDRGLAVTSFFRYQDARNSAMSWSELSGASAHVWNGSDWESY